LPKHATHETLWDDSWLHLHLCLCRLGTLRVHSHSPLLSLGGKELPKVHRRATPAPHDPPHLGRCAAGPSGVCWSARGCQGPLCGRANGSRAGCYWTEISWPLPPAIAGAHTPLLRPPLNPAGWHDRNGLIHRSCAQNVAGYGAVPQSPPTDLYEKSPWRRHPDRAREQLHTAWPSAPANDRPAPIGKSMNMAFLLLAFPTNLHNGAGATPAPTTYIPTWCEAPAAAATRQHSQALSLFPRRAHKNRGVTPPPTPGLYEAAHPRQQSRALLRTCLLTTHGENWGPMITSRPSTNARFAGKAHSHPHYSAMRHHCLKPGPATRTERPEWTDDLSASSHSISERSRGSDPQRPNKGGVENVKNPAQLVWD